MRSTYVTNTLLLLPCVPLLMFVFSASPQPPVLRPELAGLFDFEAEHTGGTPKGWTGGPPGTFAVDGEIVHGGQWSLRIERKDSDASAFTAVSKSIPVDFAGERIELRGYLRTADISEFAGLWMRQDGAGGVVEFDNMKSRQLKGTTDWTEYTIVLPFNKDARQLVFGVLAAGTGRVWADDLRLLVDGKPLQSVARVERPKTIVDLDREFDGGSRITLTKTHLTPTAIANLAMLGKVWGFLKYHHPVVTEGKKQWDYELFRVLPSVLNAADAGAARSAVHQWINTLGVVAPCVSCARLDETNLHLRPPVTWLTGGVVGSELGAALREIHKNRPTGSRQFYLSLVANINNPSFDHEDPYASIRLPDAGYQLLALYRFWNIIEYWFPYRDVIGRKWDDVLTEFIPRVALAADTDTYKREMMALIATVHDTHANLWSSLDARPPVGACRIPILVRFVENQAVVSGYSDPAAGDATGLRVGDSVAAIDGVAIAELVKQWTPYYAASNEPTRLRDIGNSMTRGACGEAALRIKRDAETIELKPARIAAPASGPAAGRTHDRPGETFRKLSPEVAYLKLSSVQAERAATYITSAAGTKGLVIDIRNYPSEFVVFALGSHLVDRPTPFARFTAGDPSNPGAFHWRGNPLQLTPAAPRYEGKVAVLVDEVSQSQAEYTTMAFRSSSNTTVIGSTTAGADGNVSAIPLPGGLRSMISGIGVFYPDKKPTQRIGIIPDIEVRPTIQGIRNGRDEVLEAALRHILGSGASALEIERLAKQ